MSRNKNRNVDLFAPVVLGIGRVRVRMSVTITSCPHGRVSGRQLRHAEAIRASSLLPNIHVRFPEKRRDKVIRLGENAFQGLKLAHTSAVQQAAVQINSKCLPRQFPAVTMY